MKFANETHGKIMQGIHGLVVEHLTEHHSKEYNLGWEHAMASAEALIHNAFHRKDGDVSIKPRCVVVLIRRPCPVEDEFDEDEAAELDQPASAPTAKPTDNSIDHPNYYNIKLICFSSDQVYTGLDCDGPYTEEMTNGSKPANIYAEHKLEMEQRVLDIDPDAVMLRAEWMYDYYLKKSNYFMNMIGATGNIVNATGNIINATGVVSYSSRQYRGITYVKEVAENMENVRKLPGGVYNFGSETTKSMYEISKEFLTLIGRDVRVEDCEPRHNLWMNCEKARKHGVIFRSVEEGLKACAKDYGLI